MGRTPPDFAAIHEQLHNSKYVTLQLLWEEYYPHAFGIQCIAEISSEPIAAPASYAKITRTFCFVNGEDGTPARLDFTPTDGEPIWSPQEIAIQAAVETRLARDRAKLETSERKAFQKNKPCPSNGKPGQIAPNVCLVDDGGVMTGFLLINSARLFELDLAI